MRSTPRIWFVRAAARALEVDFRILAKVNDRGDSSRDLGTNQFPIYGVRHGHSTFEALKGFEHLDQLDRAKDIRVLGGDLDDDLEVLTDVHQHFLHTGHRLICREASKVFHQQLQTRIRIKRVTRGG